MKIVDTFPRTVRCLENEWIPMSDGVRLAARIWRPQDAESDPVPAILELIPYRKRDAYRFGDALMHPYFAGHGYACVRVDIRGAGDSEGLLEDEYLEQEHDDALDIIAWIAAAPWCTGKVGMMGISWGGFNSLQVAARRPPALHAIITSCSTDDRYADDVHYMGGSMMLANFTWAANLFGRITGPPDPEVVGERWRAMWLERLANLPVFADTWFSHQRRDAYWKHGSVCEHFDRIVCPVFAIGGWADAYSNAIPRMLAGLSVPRIAVIGAWGHCLGHDGSPGPAIGFLQEALRWWDRWLKGVDTGIMNEPMLRAWMQDADVPRAGYAERPGRWVAEPVWPPEQGITERRYGLDPSGLVAVSRSNSVLTLCSPLDTGVASGAWCSYGNGNDLPADQRYDDAGSMVFDTAPLDTRLEILGAPVAELELEVDQPVAMTALRLCDVAPDGASLRVSYGLLNLTHRDGHERPARLEPGRRYRVRVQLADAAHAFAPGHRIRLALSTSYWPIAFPPPTPVTLSVHCAGSTLTLPERAVRAEDEAVRFAPPEQARPLEVRALEAPDSRRSVKHEFDRGLTEVALLVDDGLVHIEEIDLELGMRRTEVHRIHPRDPLSLEGEARSIHRVHRGDWRVRTETRLAVSVTAQEFVIAADVDAYENSERVYTRSSVHRIARDLG